MRALLLGLLFAGNLLTSAATASTRVGAADPVDPRDRTDAPSPPSVAGMPPIPFDHVAYDEPSDDALWARGENWKMSFSTRGALYVPIFGARQAENVVLSLSPTRVRIDGEALTVDAEARPSRDANTVLFERGAFRERWDLTPGTIEQSFVFDSLPRRGEIVVETPCPSELTTRSVGADRVFENERGRVDYGHAVAIDAAGRREPLTVAFEDDTIVLRVPESFVATASLPLVIDPLVTTVNFDTTSTFMGSPDVAYSASDDAWLVVYEVTVSATDRDVYARQMTNAGVFSSGAWVDMTTDRWVTPRCAAIPAHDRLIVVAQVENLVPDAIRGRMVIVSGTSVTFTSVFDIAGTVGGDRLWPDVGGDSSLVGPTHACVSWTRANAGADYDVGYALVGPNGTLLAPPAYFAHALGSQDTGVSVSKSNGGANWLVTWMHYDPTVSANYTDIFAARVAAGGSILNDTFPVVTSTLREVSPSVSSPLVGTSRNVIAFQTTTAPLASTPLGITLVAIDGTTVLQSADLAVVENVALPTPVREFPSVDSDGYHFLVSYSEVNGSSYALHASDVFLSGSQLRASQPHVFAFSPSAFSFQPQVAAKGGFSATANRYVVAYDHIATTSSSFDVSAVLFDGSRGGTSQAFCYGDGTGTACPCGNSGWPSRGCASSTNSAGAWLLPNGGTVSVSDGTTNLGVLGVSAGTVCLFFQGTVQGAATSFGDGLKCVGGTITRVGTVVSTGGFDSSPAGLAGLGSVPSTGGMRAYQVWYRDSAIGFCTASTFNLSNAIALYWAP